LYVLARLLSHDDHPHPSNVLVPAKTKVKQSKSSEKTKNKVKKSKSSGKRKNEVKVRSTLKDLIINNECGFDDKTKTILCPITEKEYRQCKKK
jgi:hypothetical protein